jgi:hypothetical protein
MRCSLTVCDLRLAAAIVLSADGFRVTLKCDRNPRYAETLD